MKKVTKLQNKKLPKLQNSGLINKTGYTPGTPSFGNPLNIIPSNNITMEETPMDIMAISDSGEARIMKPGEKHKFTGANVMEIPVHSFLYNEDPQSLKLKETYFNLMYGENPKQLPTNTAVNGGGDVKASYDNGLVTVTGQRPQPNIVQEDNTIKNAITSNIIGKLFSKDGFGVKPSQKSNKLLETFLNSGLEYNQWKNKLKGANKKAWSNSNYDNIFNIELDDIDTGVKKLQDGGYNYDDALGGVAGGDPMTMGIKMAADKINKKKDQILGGISTAGTMIYGLGNMPDQYSDEKMSKLGMGLQGASVGAKIGGIPGALVGGGLGAAFGWFNAKKNNIEKEEQDYMREMAYIRNSVVGQDKGIPMAKKGGKVKDKFQNTETYFSQLIRDKNKYIIPQMFGSLGDPESGTPIVHIQTEKGEAAVMADGGIVDVKAKVLHDFMHKNKVTDVFPEGTFVASSRKNNSLKKDKAEKIVLGHTPVVYDEFENEGEPKEVKMSDIFVKKEQTPAELAKIIAKKFKTVNKLNDVYSMVTNEENKIGRLPYLMKLIEMTEKKKGVKETDAEESMEAPLQERNGGYVKKFQDSGTTELESLYKNYSDKLGDFNNKYQQEYANYFKYARAANAGANLLGAVGTGLQSSAFTPAFKTNRYADQMFSKVPQYLRESAINQAQKPINTIARNLGVLNTPTSTLMGSLGNMAGRAIDSANNINRAYTMDDINQDRNRGRFLQDTENYNIAQQANADNFTRRQDNQKISQGFGYGARALTTDASLRGSQLGTQMQLDRAGIEGPFSAAAQMAQLKMMGNLMNGSKQGSTGVDVKALLDNIPSNQQQIGVENPAQNKKYSDWEERYKRNRNEAPNLEKDISGIEKNIQNQDIPDAGLPSGELPHGGYGDIPGVNPPQEIAPIRIEDVRKERLRKRLNEVPADGGISTNPVPSMPQTPVEVNPAVPVPPIPVEVNPAAPVPQTPVEVNPEGSLSRKQRIQKRRQEKQEILDVQDEIGSRIGKDNKIISVEKIKDGKYRVTVGAKGYRLNKKTNTYIYDRNGVEKIGSKSLQPLESTNKSDNNRNISPPELDNFARISNAKQRYGSTEIIDGELEDGEYSKERNYKKENGKASYDVHKKDGTVKKINIEGDPNKYAGIIINDNGNEVVISNDKVIFDSNRATFGVDDEGNLWVASYTDVDKKPRYDKANSLFETESELNDHLNKLDLTEKEKASIKSAYKLSSIKNKRQQEKEGDVGVKSEKEATKQESGERLVDSNTVPSGRWDSDTIFKGVDGKTYRYDKTTGDFYEIIKK